ncbi:MAG: putative toxin-antitoxin system toxin component, PIN family [Acidobacteriota bacterium]
MTRVTLDSYIDLSGLVFGGKPKRILEMAIEGSIEVATSDPIIAEVRRHLLSKFGWSEERAADAIASIAEFATHVTPSETLNAVPRDPDDNRVLECAVAADSEVVVTGDLDLLNLGSFRGMRIAKPAGFLAEFQARGR